MNLFGFNNATRPDRTRSASLVPFEMVTEWSLRDKPEQAALSLQPATRGRGAFRGARKQERIGKHMVGRGGKMGTLWRLKGRFIPVCWGGCLMDSEILPKTQ